ncbi:MAG: hypothetical protein HKN36_14225 [Hellea sp.]|nr:hypothetical protein [Hellea sp.]
MTIETPSDFKSKTLFRFILSFLASGCFYAPAQSQESNPTSIEEINHLAWDGVEQRLQGTGFGLMGDQIDTATGSLVFTQTDVSIPGNSDLEVAIRRKSGGRTTQTEISAQFGDWQLDVPYISTNIIKHEMGDINEPLNNWEDRCTGRAFPEPFQTYAGVSMLPDKYWNGLDISIPGMGSTKILDFPDQSVFDAPLSDKATTNNLKIDCIPTVSDGGEGFLVTTPAGTTYKFDIFRRLDMWDAASQPVRYFDNLSGWGWKNLEVAQSKAILFASEVTDKNGNWVKYDYNLIGELSKTHSNDGRVIELTYNSNGHISQVSAHGQVWGYGYAPLNGGSTRLLTQVNLPDGTNWTYDFTDFRVRPLPGHCKRDPITVSVTHPFGAVGTFTLDEIRHGYSGVPEKVKPSDVYGNPVGCSEEYHWFVMPWFETFAVTEKTLTGPSIPTSSWTYEYPLNGSDDGSFGYEPDDTVPPAPGDFRKITLTGPIGNVTEYYHNRSWSGNYGQLGKVIKKSPSGTVIEETVNIYEIKGQIFGKSHPDHFDTYSAVKHNKFASYRVQSDVTRDGETVTSIQTYNNDHTVPEYSFGSPITSIASTVGSTDQRITEIVYEHKTAEWILGLPLEKKVNGRKQTKIDYDALGRKTKQYAYDTTTGFYDVATFGYNSDGTLDWVKDAKLNEYKAENWHRGRPQKVIRPDLTEINLVINDSGWVTSSEDAKGNITTYDYDPMGRVTEIDLPGNYYDTTTINYYNWPVVFQTISKGQSETAIIYDELLRSVSESTVDNSSNWQSVTTTEYNEAGQVIFKSLPSASFTTSGGTAYTYDDLGRVLTATEIDTLNVPVATKTTEYVTAFKTRVTDAEGHQTTTHTNNFGEVILIEQPENTNTEITRDGWGQIEQVRQFGNSNGTGFKSKVQDYYYDSRQRLCRHHTPSGNSSLFKYDNAGYLIASSRGNANGTDCAEPTGNNRADYTYDAMGRLLFTDYTHHGTADTGREYDADGNLITLYRDDNNEDEVEWYNDPKNTIWRYDYNELGMLEHEELWIDGRSFDLNYQYNSDGSLFSNTRDYVKDTWSVGSFSHSFTYDRDGLGRSTGVNFLDPGVLPNMPDVSLASNGQYHYTGGLESLTYGNGQSFTQTFNARLQPEQMRATNGTATALDLSYTYTPRGLVDTMVDGVDNNNNRVYGYDGQGRLTSASGPWGGDGLGAFKYDSLGNVLEKSLGDRDITLTYNAFNRVSQSVDSGATGTRNLTYDSRGNVKSIGGINMNYDATDRPTGLSGDESGSYRYDGHGRRVKSITSTPTGNVTRYNVYDASGSLAYVVQVDQSTANDDYVMNYVKMDGKTLSRVKSNGTRLNYTDEVTYLHHDHLGSAVAGTDDTGAVLWTEQYTPFGISLVNDAANDNQAGFTGHIKDTDTGLTYMQARYYDPVIGRFLSHDPVQFSVEQPLMFNRYGYTFNNPINATDPFGETTVCNNDRSSCTSVVSDSYQNSGHEGVSASDPSTDTGTTISGTPAMDQAASEMAEILDQKTGRDVVYRADLDEERSGLVQSVYTITKVSTKSSNSNQAIVNADDLVGADFVLHTEPTNRNSGVPGRDDGSASLKADAPNYALHGTNATAIEVNAGVFNIRPVNHDKTSNFKPTEDEPRMTSFRRRVITY